MEYDIALKSYKTSINMTRLHQIKQITIIIGIFTLGFVACRPAPTSSPTQDIPVLIEPTNTPIPPSATPTFTLTPTSTKTPVPPTSTPEPVVYGPENFPDNVNPLTGLEVEDPTLLNNRPVAVKVNLVPRTTYRPTWGVSMADIVWDYYHNDGYTRLHAIFHGQNPSLVGAIRSGRMPDHDLIQMYKSIFTYGSADALVNFRLLNASYSELLVLEGQFIECPPTAERPLCRIKPSGPNLLLTSPQALIQNIINKGIDNSRQNLDGMTFHETTPDSDIRAETVSVHYSSDNYSKWNYDPIVGKYLLSMDGNLASRPEDETYVPLIDQLNNQQIQAENVVFLFIRHQYYQPPPNEIIEILMSGSGKGFAFRDGKMYEVQWNRPAIDSVLYLTYPDGSRYPFKPGTTWFHVVGETTEFLSLPENSFRVNFKFP